MKKILSIVVISIFILTLTSIYIEAGDDKEVIKPPKKGYVTLSKEEYKKLLEKLKPKKAEFLKSPQDWVVKIADYDLKIDKELKIIGTVMYELESLRDDKWIEAPLQRYIKGISFHTPPDGILLKYRGNDVYFGTNLKRSFKLSARVNLNLQKQGLNEYLFAIRSSESVINRFSITWPEKILKLKSSPLMKVDSAASGSIKKLIGLSMPNRTLNFHFEVVETKTVEDVTEKRIEVDSTSLFNIESGLLRASYHLRYKTNRGGFEELIVKLPKDLDIHSVNCSGLLSWDIDKKENYLLLKVKLEKIASEIVDLYITAEKAYEGKETKLKLPIVLPLNVDRMRGSIGISVVSEAEVMTENLDGAEEIDISDLPQEFRRISGYKPVLAYKYIWDSSDPMPDAVILVREYEKVAVLTANIESAEFSTVYTTRGKGLLRGNYWIRNNIKQNLKVIPPKGFKIWSSFINGEPVKPTIAEDGSLLIPLKKSVNASSSILFQLELIFFFENEEMGEDGILSFELPLCDLQIMKLGWELLLPSHYDYDEWEGNLQQVVLSEYYETIKQEETTGKIDTKFQYSQKNAIANQFMLNDVQQQQITEQTNRLIQRFQQREGLYRLRKGRLPVKFEIPRVGKQFLFKKLLIVDKVPKITVEYDEDC
jgi:hypothetical protein